MHKAKGRPETGMDVRAHFRVPGLGRRVSGSGFQVQVPGLIPEPAPAPVPAAETWDLRICSRHLPPGAATCHPRMGSVLGQHVVLPLPNPYIVTRSRPYLRRLCLRGGKVTSGHVGTGKCISLANGPTDQPINSCWVSSGQLSLCASEPLRVSPCHRVTLPTCPLLRP